MKFHKHFKGLAEETKKLFRDYRWPGNVREIRNVMERAILLGDGELVRPTQVEFPHFNVQPPESFRHLAVASADGLSLYELEKQALLQALEKSGDNQSQAAKLLKISRDTLRYRIKKYALLRH